MTKEEIYAAWNPPDSPWTPWCKTVLFSYLTERHLEAPFTVPTKWEMPPNVRGDAIVADVGGAGGVAIGVALCLGAGFRPVPVYNACPFATYNADLISSFAEDPKPALLVSVAVDLSAIMFSLANAVKVLATAKLPADAPPAFLIDGNRKGRGWITQAQYGWFDNRSFVTASDFPSAAILRDQSLSRLIVVQGSPKIQADLRAVLLAWQSEGISMWHQKPWEPWNPQLMIVKRPSIFARVLNRIKLATGFRQTQLGPFGHYIPPSSS